jgi:enolase-phosphatase E1
VLADLAELQKEHAADQDPPPLVEPYFNWLIDRDRKSPALKSLQGKIWEQGYKDGSLRSPVFADVRPAIERWRSSGIDVNIFSSGSVLAQKLLFAHTDAGDLTHLFSRYFDTGVGKKTEADSYRRIAQTLNLEPGQVHFISDIESELDAAADAGMKTSMCIRPGNAVQENSSRHRTIKGFDEVD